MQLLVLFSKGCDRNNSSCHEGLGLDLRRTVLAKKTGRTLKYFGGLCGSGQQRFAHDFAVVKYGR